MLEVKNLVKRYGNKYAVDDISFTVERGEILGFLGPNGAGKSTTMNIITGYLSSTEGTVTIDGHEILEDPIAAKSHIGYLPEQPPLYMDMTVDEYLKFVCAIKDVKPSYVKSHLDDITELIRITDVRKRLIKNLSKGYKQRVGMAQALCGSPEALILDEPTAGLDPRQSSEMCALVKSLSGEHTVLLSSHILSEVQSVCDRVLILHHGKIICDSALSALRCGEKRLRAVIACGEGALLPALRTLRSVRRVTVERGGEPGTTTVVLTAAEGVGVERELFRLLSGMQTPLIRLAPVEDSLEEVFLRATREAG